MKILTGILLAIAVGTATAGGPLIDNSTNQKAIAVQVQKAKASAQADGSAVINQAPAAKIPDPAAIAPNPSAPAPSAQCRFGWGVTGAGVAFGAGITASEWDEICGLWLAAQQTTGKAKSEAAAAAFCLTMKKAKVHSPTCLEWDQGQQVVQVDMNENRANISFGGAGYGGGWN